MLATFPGTDPEAVFTQAAELVTGLAASEAQRGLLLTALAGLKRQARADEALIYARLPLLVHVGCGCRVEAAMPLAAATTLLFLGIDILDDLADGDLPEHWQARRPAEINLAAATLLAALPQAILATLPVPASRLAAMQRTLALGLLAMSAGQQQDLALAGSTAPDPRMVEDSVVAKSGEEVAMFAKLSAQFAGAEPAVAAAYADYGRALGAGGQLASDCHDIFQAEVSNDLANGSRTLPIALHLQKLGGRERREFLALLDEARLGEAARQEVRRRLRAAGQLRHCALIVEIYHQTALKALALAGPQEPAAQGLKVLVAKISFFAK